MAYADILGKERFSEILRSKGYTVDEIEDEWLVLDGIFTKNFSLALLEAMSEPDRLTVVGDGELETAAGATEVLGRLNEYIKAHEKALDYGGIADAAAKKSYEDYLKQKGWSQNG